jgi:hypothetical protein
LYWSTFYNLALLLWGKKLSGAANARWSLKQDSIIGCIGKHIWMNITNRLGARNPKLEFDLSFHEVSIIIPLIFLKYLIKKFDCYKK